MEKKIDLRQTVYQLTQAYPEIIEIMASLGFTEIRKKAVRLSVGKLVTIPKGASMKGIGIDRIVDALRRNGFTVEGFDEEPEKDAAAHGQASGGTATSEKIKSYLKRLNDGEDMETVRADFAQHFKDVDATEIMKAEQELIAGGQPVKEVKELCDIHSALFHKTDAAKADDFHHGMHHDQERMMMGQAGESKDKAAALRGTAGHPLQTFYRENEAIAHVLDMVEDKLDNGGDAVAALAKARSLAVHYAKKGDLIYPLLNVKYGIYGPSQVMWTIDDEIRAEVASLLKTAGKNGLTDDKWAERARAVAKRAREMTFKENRILFPVCAANLSDDDWKQMYADSKSYGFCLGVKPETWPEGEEYLRRQVTMPEPQSSGDGEARVAMPGGSLTISQLAAMLDTLPMELTFVDADNINRYFNQPYAAKAFKRPLSALGREVFACHPPKIEPMVRTIIQDFRDGKRDRVPVWLEKNGRTMLITYMAVRDAEGHYIGTLECVQDMEAAKAHFTK